MFNLILMFSRYIPPESAPEHLNWGAGVLLEEIFSRLKSVRWGSQRLKCPDPPYGGLDTSLKTNKPKTSLICRGIVFYVWQHLSL